MKYEPGLLFQSLPHLVIKLMSDTKRTIVFLAVALAVSFGRFAYDIFFSDLTCEIMLDQRLKDCSASSRLDFAISTPVETVVSGLVAIFCGVIAAVVVVVAMERRSDR